MEKLCQMKKFLSQIPEEDQSYYVNVGRNDVHYIDCEQSLHKSVEEPAFLRQLCLVTQTNKNRMTKSVNLQYHSKISEPSNALTTR